jgi:hypothetical protein
MEVSRLKGVNGRSIIGGAIGEIRAALASARRRESRLLRRLGRRALESLSEGQILTPEDGHMRLMIEDLRRVQGEIGCLMERLRGASLSPFSDKNLYPPPPGSDTHFPFSR